MLDHVLPLLDSPWLLLVVFAMVAVDGFVPVVPGETVVITATVAASADGAPLTASLVGVLAATAAGALAGDCVSYALGRYVPGRRAVLRRRTLAAAHERGRRMLERHGPVAVISARFVPGGRTAITLVAGSTGYGFRAFCGHAAAASALWAAYIVGLGCAGGTLFGDRPVLGAGAGIAFAVVLGTVLEAGGRVRRRSAGRDTPCPEPAGERRERVGVGVDSRPDAPG